MNPSATNNHSMNSSAISSVTVQNPVIDLSARRLVESARTTDANELASLDATDASAEQQRWKVTPKRLAFAALAVLAAAGVSAFTYHWWTVGRFIESTDDAYVGGD